jgi:signal peptidase II
LRHQIYYSPAGVQLLAVIALAFVVFLLDFASKSFVATHMTEFQTITIIPGFFSLQFVHNPGAAFGMLAHQQWLFVLVTLVAIAAILLFLRHPDAKRGVVPVAMSLLLGGAMGNLLDRVRFGKVIDFFLFYWKDYSFPNFNVADAAITVGVGLFILHLTLTGEKKQS